MRKKQITFDIDTNVCKQIFGEDKFRQPYKDIRRFLSANGFMHIEGSAYMSSHAMSNMEIAQLIDDMVEKHPYLTKCIREMHQADIGRSHSLKAQFEYDGTPGRFAQNDKQQAHSEKKRSSVLVKLEEKKQVLAKREANQGDEPQRKHQKDNHSL